MNTLKTLLVAAVLSTVAYGVYSNYTARPPLPPPADAGNWDTAPQVQLPPSTAHSGVPSAAPPTLPPTASATPTGFAPPAAALPGAPPSSVASVASGSPFPSLPPSIPPTPSTISPAAPVDPSGASLPGVSIGNAPPTSPALASPALPVASPPVSAGPTISVAPPTTPAQPTAYATTTPAPNKPDPASAITTPPSTTSPASPTGAIAPASNTDPYTPSAAPAGIAPVQPQAGQRERFVAAMGQVQTMLDQGQLATGLLKLSEWFDDPSIPADEHTQLLDLLDRLAATVIYSRENLLEPAYQVQVGDTLLTVADRYQVPWQLLAKINGVTDPQQIRSGEKLKVVRGPFDAVVNLRTNEVALMLRGHYAGRFPCAVGNDAATPVGEYAIREKVVNPTYYGPGGVVDADDPNNPLGERQLDLGNKLSIHATNDPNGMAPNETRGSIRLARTDCDDVFDILSVGSRVVIKR